MKYEMPWRKAYEAFAAIGWLVTLIAMTAFWAGTNIPSGPFIVMLLIGFCALCIRSFQTLRIWNRMVRLAGKGFTFMPAEKILKWMNKNPNHLFMGLGFEWKPIHTQRAFELLKRDIDDFYPPDWYLKLKNIPLRLDGRGLQWIHGVEEKETVQAMPLAATEGHNLVFGAPGSGKTRCAETMIFQAVSRGDTVFVFDPKGDRDMEQIVEEAAAAAGRSDKLVKFHPAFPSKSIRVDPLATWSRETQIASRIAGLMQTDGGGDSFVQFAWRSMYVVSDALIYVGIRPNLKNITRYVSGGPDALAKIALEKYYSVNLPNWETVLSPIIEEAKKGKIESPLKKSGASPEVIAYAHFYINYVPEEEKDESVSKVVGLAVHPREHYNKVITNVLPLLTMLTAGALGELLSPDPTNIDDDRPIFDNAKLVRDNYIVYVSLDSLSDAEVGSAIGGIWLADLTAVAGEIYNHAMPEHRIQLFIDEASEVINEPLVRILNKGRGAKMIATLFAQTLPDFEVRMGNAARAKQALGNCNNFYAFRTTCAVTQEFIAEKFGETEIIKVGRSHSTSTQTQEPGLELGGAVSVSMSENTTDIFPPHLLGKLPDLHYIASVSGGQLRKCRLSKLTTK